MKKHIPAQADRIRQQHSRRHRWYRLVLGLSCIVVFCTVYALIIPALTMEKTPIWIAPLLFTNTAIVVMMRMER